MHSLFGVNILQVHGFFPKIRFIQRNDLPFFIQEIAFSILFEYPAEHPSMSMIIGNLRMLEFGIQLTGLFQEILIALGACYRYPSGDEETWWQTVIRPRVLAI